MTIPVALVGLGKIARDQHLPALAQDSRFALTATVDPAGAGIDGVPHFTTLDALLESGTQLRAVALCTPPQVRMAVALQAIGAGMAVMLEKPPAASLSQAQALVDAAEQADTTLFATWHSREAGGVTPARQWLDGRKIHSVAITWREDVRHWHPGQAWIWQPGGLGVFDPGINALSILTAIMPQAVTLQSAALQVPENCQAPVSAQLAMAMAGDMAITADLDFLQTGKQTWEIVVETDGGRMVLADGGSELSLPGEEVQRHPDREYAGLYARFADLIESGQSDVDLAPFALVADAFLLGEHARVEPFIE